MDAVHRDVGRKMEELTQCLMIENGKGRENVLGRRGGGGVNFPCSDLTWKIGSIKTVIGKRP